VLRGQVMIDNGDGVSTPFYVAGGCRRPFQQILASALSGIIARSATSPLERVKIMLQTQTPGSKIKATAIIKSIFRTEGIKGCFRGNGVNALKLLGEGFIRFCSYDFLLRTIQESQGGKSTSMGQKFFAGSTAGFVTCVITYPLETIRVRLASSISSEIKVGATRTAITLVQREGFKSLFRGLGPAMLAFIPYAGIDLALFDTLRSAYVNSGKDGEEREPTPLILLVCGGTSATAGQTVSYPLNLIRTKLQADSVKKYNGMMDCFRKVFVSEGVLGMYRGFGINFIKSVPSIAVSYAVADKVRRVALSKYLEK